MSAEEKESNANKRTDERTGQPGIAPKNPQKAGQQANQQNADQKAK